MNRTQRIILVIYFLVVAYCCIWVPWKTQTSTGTMNLGDGWVWSGPQSGNPLDEFLQNRWLEVSRQHATPNFPLIGLRLIAATALGAAAMTAAGFKSLRPPR